MKHNIVILAALLLSPLVTGVAAEAVASSSDEHGKLVVCFASKGDYRHTPASETGLRGLADLLHKYGYRGTYYLKPATVRACQADLKEWREKYGDEVGWFADGCSLQSAASELAQTRELVNGQPVRSAGQLRYGKDWVEWFQKHGVESVWGRCYEQTATDGITDRGCPFGFYYARPDCFKAPNPGSGGVISVPWLSNDLNLIFRTAQQSTFTFDPNDAQDIGVATPGDDSFWVAELNEYKKQTKYNKLVPLVIQQEIEEFDFTTRREWKESGSAIFENLLKVLKREGIQVVTVSEAVDLYKAAYPEMTPPTYGLFGNIAATTPIIRTNKSLQVVSAPFASARKAEFKCFGPTLNGFYATGRIGRTWYYYDAKGARLDEFGKNFSYFDKAGLLVFVEGNSTPVRITPYSNLPADAYRTAILPEMSPWFDTQKFIPTANVKMVKSERELRVTANTVASRSLVFTGDSLPYGVMLWGDFSAYRVPPNAPAGTKILGDEGLFIPWVLIAGENHLDLVLGVELSSVREASPSIAGVAPFSITDLRTEGVAQPLGIEEAAPRFSWRYEAAPQAPRGFRQNAWRIQVASSLTKLSQGPADLWDSGKQAGSDTLNILYAGKPLQSATRYFWQVTGFDDAGKSFSSQPHYFETGLMKADDWSGAEWIGAQNERPKTIPANLQRLGDATFETRFRVLEGSAVVLFQTTYAFGKENKLEIQTGQPGKLIVTPFEPKNKAAASKEFALPMHIAPGTWHTLKVIRQGGQATFEIDSQKVAMVTLPADAGKTGTLALGASAKPKQGVVQYDDFRLIADGATLVQESFDNPAVFAFQEYFHSSKSYAMVKEGVLEVRALNTYLDPKDGLAAPLFRKTFAAGQKKIVRARAYVSGLGYYTFWLNGKRLDDFLLHPGFARFNKTAYYTVYDLTDHLAADNVLAFELGRGWYAMTTPTLWGETFAGDWMAEPALRVLVTIDYADGSRQTVVSSPSFKTAPGPTLVDSVKAGEIYDARKELPGWNAVGFDDKHWRPAVVAAGKMPSAAPGLTAQLFEPIRVVESVSPVSIVKVEDEPDAWVVDFGKNMAGTVELKIRAEAGQKIRMNHLETIVDRHGRERWNNFGPKDTGSFQTDIYIAKGGDEESYQARYSYKGFRYVHIMGLKEKPRPDQVTAKVFNSDMASAGSFRSSSELWNKIWKAGRRSIQSNMHSIPTDCPQWEKLGWTCDDSSPYYAMAFNFELRKLYEKRLQDFADDISPDGRIRNTVPSSWAKGDDPAWVGSYVQLVWKHYQTYGDRRVIEKHFDNLKLYMSTLIKEGETSEKPPLLTKPRHGLGDWVNPDDNCPPEGALIYYDCYFYRYLRMMADLATLLRRTEDVTYYTTLATQLKKQFNAFFFDEKEGCYYSSNRSAGFRQSPQAVALAFGLVPEERAPSVVKRLVQDIHDRKDHFWVGILGMEAIADALCENGQSDIAYSAHLKDDGPSLGNMIREGATSLWESYSDKNARSLNHKMFATPLGWMARYVAGLHVDGALGEGPGFRHAVISPHPAPALLQFAELDYDAPIGRYHSGWKVVAEGIQFSLEIPPNATAEFKIPSGGVKNPLILEAHVPVWKDGRFMQGVNGVSAGSSKAPDLSLELASGKYEFLLKQGE